MLSTVWPQLLRSVRRCRRVGARSICEWNEYRPSWTPVCCGSDGWLVSTSAAYVSSGRRSTTTSGRQEVIVTLWSRPDSPVYSVIGACRQSCRKLTSRYSLCIYSVSQKIPLRTCGNFSKTVGIFQPNFTCLLRVPNFLSTLDYKFLFSYLQLWRSYAILGVTTQFTSGAQDVHHQLKRTQAFCDIFPKQLGIFSPNFTHLLNVHTYARTQFFVHLSPTMTKLCHIKCDHTACVSVDGAHFEHIMVVALNIA